MAMPNGLGQRLGILGGTFDPVHVGHVAIARCVQRKFALDSVMFIPAAHPPHKIDHVISPFKDRVAMLESAISGQPGLFVSTMEAQRTGPSFSVDTLSLLRKELPAQTQLFFIIGMDAFEEIATWKKFDHLLDLTNLVVVDRPAHKIDQLAGVIARCFNGFHHDSDEDAWVCAVKRGNIYPMFAEPVNVSSTRIRRMVQRREPIQGLVHPLVDKYIAEHGLYR